MLDDKSMVFADICPLTRSNCYEDCPFYVDEDDLGSSRNHCDACATRVIAVALDRLAETVEGNDKDGGASIKVCLWNQRGVEDSNTIADSLKDIARHVTEGVTE